MNILTGLTNIIFVYKKNIIFDTFLTKILYNFDNATSVSSVTNSIDGSAIRGNTGTVSLSTVVSISNSKSLYFNGGSFGTANYTVPSGGFSISVWFYSTSFNGGSNPRLYQSSIGDNQSIMWPTNTANSVTLNQNNNSQQLGTIYLNCWNNLIITFNTTSNQSLYYLNNSLVLTYGSAFYTVGSSYYFSFGAKYGGGTDFFIGYMDNIAIYNKVLTSTDVNTIYMNTDNTVFTYTGSPTISTITGYTKYIRFNGNGTIKFNKSTTVQILVVGGGGGGGGCGGNKEGSGGGGGGGFGYGTFTPQSNISYTITIGGGGAGGVAGAVGSNGGSTTFIGGTVSITANGGGGGGGSAAPQVGANGASGGGGCGNSSGHNGGTGSAAAAGTVSGATITFKGNNGGFGGHYAGGGGGGGAGGVGASTTSDNSNFIGANGGNGFTWSINNTSYAGGGGGGGGASNTNTTTNAAGGTGQSGGGKGSNCNTSNATAAGSNTGSGGGGAGGMVSSNGAAGGSGIVILAFN